MGGGKATEFAERFRIPIGTLRDCLETSLLLAETEGARLVGANVTIGDSAVLVHSTVWDDVAIGAGAQLFECVVADGVRIPAGARFERCAIVRATGRTPAGDERLEGELLVRAFA